MLLYFKRADLKEKIAVASVHRHRGMKMCKVYFMLFVFLSLFISFFGKALMWDEGARRLLGK